MATTDIAVIEPGKYLALNHSQAELREIIRANLGDEELTEFDLPRVKIPAGGSKHWVIPTPFGEESSTELEGVLLFYKRTRAYWENPNPTGEPPQCRSLDTKTGIGNPGGDCRTCPFAQFGSSKKGSGNAQACSEKEVWFLLREGSFLPTVLSLPATSLKNAKSYRTGLGTGGIVLHSVVTSITISPQAGEDGEYGIATPKFKAKLSPEDAKAAAALATDLLPVLNQAAVAIGGERDDVPPAPAAPVAAPEPVVPAAAAATVDATAVEE